MSIFGQLAQVTTLTLDSYIAKARRAIAGDVKKEEVIERKALTISDTSQATDVGFRERTSGVTFEILRQMSLRDSVIAAIIQTRIGQVKSFGIVQSDKYSVGFKIIMRDHEAEPSEKDKREMLLLEGWILNTGLETNRPEESKLSLTEFLGLTTRDILTYDQIAVETVNANDDTLHYFIPSSAGSIRFAAKNLRQDKNLIDTYNSNPAEVTQPGTAQRDKDIAEKDVKRPDDDVYRYVQLIGGRIARAFYDDELVLKMMNPVTEVDTGGYSIGPLELCANIVSYHLFTEAHNRLFFVQGFASRGILHIEGDVPGQQLEAFRRQWREQVSGAQNSWRTPILAGANKINWVPLQMSNRDMEWSAWMEYLIKLMCAIYAIAPQEINFDITRAGPSSLGEGGSRNETILEDSRDRGLRPLLRFFEDFINEQLISRFDSEAHKKYKFVFCGLDAETKKQELERQEKEGQVFKTINEIRSEHDLEDLSEGGDIVMNTNYMQWYTQYSNEAQVATDKLNAASQEGDSTADIPTDIDNPDDESETADIPTDFAKSRSKRKSPKLIKVQYFSKE